MKVAGRRTPKQRQRAVHVHALERKQAAHCQPGENELKRMQLGRRYRTDGRCPLEQPTAANREHRRCGIPAAEWAARSLRHEFAEETLREVCSMRTAVLAI